MTSKIFLLIGGIYAPLILYGLWRSPEPAPLPVYQTSEIQQFLHQETVRSHADAVNQFDAQDQLVLGWAYYNGIGVEKDHEKSAEWFQKAANQGNSEAQYYLGRLYYSGEYGEKNIPKGKKLLEKSALQGYFWAQNDLGYILETEEKYKEALDWYLRAAAQNCSRSCLNIGYLYQNGLGVKKNDEEAKKWFKKGEADLEEWKKTRKL